MVGDAAVPVDVSDARILCIRNFSWITEASWRPHITQILVAILGDEPPIRVFVAGVTGGCGIVLRAISDRTVFRLTVLSFAIDQIHDFAPDIRGRFRQRPRLERQIQIVCCERIPVRPLMHTNVVGHLSRADMCPANGGSVIYEEEERFGATDVHLNHAVHLAVGREVPTEVGPFNTRKEVVRVFGVPDQCVQGVLYFLFVSRRAIRGVSVTLKRERITLLPCAIIASIVAGSITLRVRLAWTFLVVVTAAKNGKRILVTRRPKWAAGCVRVAAGQVLSTLDSVGDRRAPIHQRATFRVHVHKLATSRETGGHFPDQPVGTRFPGVEVLSVYKQFRRPIMGYSVLAAKLASDCGIDVGGSSGGRKTGRFIEIDVGNKGSIDAPQVTVRPEVNSYLGVENRNTLVDLTVTEMSHSSPRVHRVRFKNQVGGIDDSEDAAEVFEKHPRAGFGALSWVKAEPTPAERHEPRVSRGGVQRYPCGVVGRYVDPSNFSLEVRGGGLVRGSFNVEWRHGGTCPGEQASRAYSGGEKPEGCSFLRSTGT